MCDRCATLNKLWKRSMPYLTLGQASRETGVHKSTIARAVQDGRLSANHNEHGHYQIDPAELFRVFDPLPRETPNDPNGDPQRDPAQPPATPMESGDTQWYRQQIENRDQQLADVQAELSEKESALDELREALRALPSPEQYQADLEKLEHEKSRALSKQKAQFKNILTEQKTTQAKVIAAQKQYHEQKSEKWKLALEDRQREIKKARAEAEMIREKELAQKKELELERARVAALESRGLIARLLNRKPTAVDG